MEVVVLKFANGDEIMARQLSEDVSADTIIVEKPRGILPQRMPDGQISVAFVPWVISNPDGEFTVRLQSLAALPASAGKEMETAYLSQTSSLQLL
jgi:hypothetical protein